MRRPCDALDDLRVLGRDGADLEACIDERPDELGGEPVTVVDALEPDGRAADDAVR